MNEKVMVTGHKNPDTDSICSAIAYADFKHQTGTDAVPVRIGRVSRETAFVLDYFNVPEPEYLSTVKTQVSDLNMDIVTPVTKDISLKEAWEILKESNLEILPVEDEMHKLCGLVSVVDIARAYISMPEYNVLSISSTPLLNVIKTLSANLVCGADQTFKDSGKVVIAAMTPDGMEEYIEKGDIVIVGNRKRNQIKAISESARCIILTCGSKADDETKSLAEEKNCILLETEFDTFTTARLLYQSIPVSFTMTSSGLICFKNDDYADTAKDKMLKTRFHNYPVVDNDNRFVGFISRYHLINPNRKKVILVDHSELPQTINGIGEANLLEIIDHHRIGDIQTDGPIYYRNEPVGSTATIVANMFFENDIFPSKNIAGILCAAIISDTVKFKSPTSTQADVHAAKELADIAGINIDKFAAKMFEAGSSLKNMTPEEIIHSDFKEYHMGKYKIGIGQVNTTDLNGIKKTRPAILKLLNDMTSGGGYHIVLLIMTDIINDETEVIFSESHKGLVAKAFNPLKDESSFMMKGVVSRKKQVVPKLSAVLSK